jgi:ATP-dependent DNA helicase RecQ
MPRNESPAAEALRRWRRDRAAADGVPAYVIFTDRTMDELLARRPSSPGELAAIHGLGAKRLEQFGRELYAAVKEALGLSPGEAPAPTHGPVVAVPRASRSTNAVPRETPPGGELYEALAAWRLDRSKDDGVPAFHVFPNRVLEAIAEARPSSRDELAEVWGIGPTKIERYGDELLRVVAAA